MSAKRSTVGKASKTVSTPVVNAVVETTTTTSPILPDSSSSSTSVGGDGSVADNTLPTNIFLAVHKPAKEPATTYIRKSDLKDVFAVHIIRKDDHDVVEVYFRNRENPLQIQTDKEDTEKVSRCIRTHTRNHLNGATQPKKRNRASRGGSTAPDDSKPAQDGVSGEESLSELE